MKGSYFQRTMCFNLKIPNMFQCKKTKTVTVWEICQVYFLSSHFLGKVGALFMMLNLGFRNSSQCWDFRLAYLLLARVLNIPNRFIITSTSTQDWWFRNILTHPCHPSRYLSRFHSFDGFELAPCLSGLHAEQLDEPEFALRMPSKLSLIPSMAASIILFPKEVENRERNLRNPRKETKKKGKQTWDSVLGEMWQVI